jgi:hypothetical protein
MAPDSAVELIFFMLILKIPIVYLCLVIWWAIKAEPEPEEGASATDAAGPDDRGPRRRRRLRRPIFRPHGGPSRRPQPGLAAGARAEKK